MKEVLIVGVVVAASLLFLFSDSLTGAVFVACPEGYAYHENLGYCAENVCFEQGVKCVVQNGFIERPDCVCWRYFDRVLCGFEGNEKLSSKSSLCTRQGHVGQVCGAYDSRIKMCVSE
jgi:hypothetical protein